MSQTNQDNGYHYDPTYHPHLTNNGPLGNGTGGTNTVPSRNMNSASKVGAWNSGAPGMGGAGNVGYAKGRRMSVTGNQDAGNTLGQEQRTGGFGRWNAHHRSP